MIEALTLATSELWCIAPGHAAALRQPPEVSDRRPMPRHPYALVEIAGVLTKRRTLAIRERVNAAAANPDIGEILLLVDSPGGELFGVHDLYLTISAAAERKRVVAVVEDICASGALYAVAGASEIVIGETALTGSIGVYVVKIDETKLLEKIGVEVVIVRSGEHKGAGVQGVKLTPDQLAELKRRVDVQARHFVAAIAKGRRMSAERARELADGRVFIGREAIAAGLADRVGMFENIEAEMQGRTIGLMYRGLRGGDAFAKINALVADDQQRTLAAESECRARVVAQYTCLADAAAAYQKQQDEAAAAAQKEKDEALQRYEARYGKKNRQRRTNGKPSHPKEHSMTDNTTTEANAEATPPKRGVEPIGGDAAAAVDAWDGLTANEFAQLKIQERTDKGIKRDRAAKSVFAAYPGLREAMVEEANERRR